MCPDISTPGDVAEAVSRAIVSSSVYFANVWTDAQERGQAILVALATGDTPPGDPPARNWLRENNVLDDAGDYAVPMVRRWVSETKIHQKFPLA